MPTDSSAASFFGSALTSLLSGSVSAIAFAGRCLPSIHESSSASAQVSSLRAVVPGLNGRYAKALDAPAAGDFGTKDSAGPNDDDAGDEDDGADDETALARFVRFDGGRCIDLRASLRACGFVFASRPLELGIAPLEDGERTLHLRE